MTRSSLMGGTTVGFTHEKRMDRIRSLSRIMAIGCLATSILLPAAMLFYWIATPTQTLLDQAGLPGVAPVGIGFSARAVAFVVSMAPLGALVYGLLNARHCFTAFAAGHIFSIGTIGRLRAFSIAVAVAALLKPFVGAVLSVVLSWNEAPGTRTLALTVGSDTLIALIFSGTVAVIAWVMTEAIAISEENKQFI